MKKDSEERLLLEIEQNGSVTMRADILLGQYFRFGWDKGLEWAAMHNFIVTPRVEPDYPGDMVTLTKAR